MRTENMTGRLLLLIILLVLQFACGQQPPSMEKILFDFENDEELDLLYWKCHTLMSLSDEHVTHGEKSLHIELFPSPYPGFNPCIQRSDWRGFAAFTFDVFNPSGDDLELVVRIDDLENQPDYKDRFNRRIALTPGQNAVTIPLDGLLVSGKQRKLNTGSIQAVVLFMVSPERKVDLYVDYGRLVPIDGPLVN